ncbi:MAG TPA: DUF1572 family protein [Blastocatellia bacterium]|nr:DUF1572 family protein [Blastocatellia bacterium]
MLSEDYIKDAIRHFRSLKWLAEKSLAQVTDEHFFTLLDDESNSIALMMKHIAGNMHSRWKDFLTTDGEKPDRNRDSEFVVERDDTKESLLAFWESGWQCLFDAIEPLEPDDLGKTVLIRGEPHLVVEAINRQLSHYSYHVGQIVFLAKHFASRNWESLSIPRGKSAEMNASEGKKRGQAWLSAESEEEK